MLPDFPALKEELHRITIAKLGQLVDAGDPVLSQIKRFRQREGCEMRYEQQGGGTVQEGFEKIGSEFQVSLGEVPTLIGEKLDAKLQEMANQIGSQSAKMFFRKLGESCEKVGTSVDAGGKAVSAEMFLDMMSTVQMEFGPDGKPTHSFIVHPDMIPAVKKVAEQLENDPRTQAKARRNSRPTTRGMGCSGE
jgi:hypothetical protein